MTQETPLSRGDPISTLVARCFQSFGELDVHISNGSQSPSKQKDEDGFLDELGRLRVWAANIGAHRTGRISLDFRLRDAPHIRTRIQGLLYDLEENIRRTSDIISGASLPWDRLEHDSDSDTESSESELDDDEFGGTEREQLKNSIHETITLLSRLSMAVRNPAMHDRHINSSQLVAVAYSRFDVDRVSNKFPNVPPDLANNLGKAISRRRQYLHSRKERHEKLAQGLEAAQRQGGLDGKSEAPSESMAATSLPEAIKAMSQEDLEREPYSDSEASHTSFARSNFDDGEGQKIPPFPMEGAGGTPFECPICFMMISVHSQESWKRHVFRDIHPYVCTFPDCTTPQRLFSRRREWFLHELEMHRCHWQCAHGCGGDFKIASQFEDHVRASHPESASPEDLAKLSSASSRPMSQRILVNCSMCGEKDISLQKLKRHLGRHQEDLALFAMPFTGYEMEENETEETGFFEENASIKSEDSVSSSVLSLEGDRKETIINLQSKEAVLRAIHDGEDGVDRCPVCAWELEDGECAQCGPQFDDNGTTSWKNSIDNFSDMDETSEHGMSGEEVGNKKEDKGLPKTFQEAPIPQVNIWKQRAESKAAKSKVSNATPANKPAASVAKSPAQNSPNKAGDATANSARKGKDFSANGGYQNLRDGGHENEGDEGEEPRPGVQPVSSTLGAGSTTSTNPQASTNMESTIVPPTTGEVGHFDIGSTTENDENKQRSRTKAKENHGSSDTESPPRSFSPAPPTNHDPLIEPVEQPRTPAPPDFPSALFSDEPSRRRSRRPPPTVTQPSTNSSYRPTAAASRPPDNKLQDPKQAATREQLRRERQADEFWAQYHRDRQERREGRKMNEQSHPADDWEARLEEGRRRVEQEHRDRQQETRHNPSINAAPADISEDEDWGAQLEEGRRRLAELRRTEETAASDARTVNDPLRRRNTTGIGENGQLDRLPGVTSDSSSAPRPISERHGADAILASQIADAQADIQRAEARIAARRDREQRERMVEGNYGAFAYDGVNSYAPQPNDFYNPRLGIGMGILRHKNRRLPPMTHQGGPPLGELGWERGQRVIHEARGGRRQAESSKSPPPTRRQQEPENDQENK